MQIPVSVSISALWNDYAHNSITIFTKFCMQLGINVVALTSIVCETNQKYFSDFRGVQIHILVVFRLRSTCFSTIVAKFRVR